VGVTSGGSIGTRSVRCRAAVAMLGALCACLLAACGGSSGESSQPPEDKRNSAESLTGADLVEKVKPGTVAVVAQPPGETTPPKVGGLHAHGSGIIYDARRGLVLTSNHLVEGAGSIKVRVNERTEIQGRAVARAQCDDVALLALSPKPAGLVDLPLGDVTKLREGETVTAVGYLLPPDGRQRLITGEGPVSAIDVPGQVHPDLPSLPSLVLHQAPLQAPSSGGALVNSKGELMGLNTVIGDPGAGPFKAVSSRRLTELLGQLKPGSGSRFRGWGSEHGECHTVLAKLSQESLVSHGGPDDGKKASGPGSRSPGAGGAHGGGHGG
jgi:S1-C subfamily serine protease